MHYYGLIINYIIYLYNSIVSNALLRLNTPPPYNMIHAVATWRVVCKQDLGLISIVSSKNVFFSIVKKYFINCI